MSGEVDAAESIGARTLHGFRDEIRTWAESLLRPYIDEIKKLSAIEASPPGQKEINDSIWGTIVLEPLEIIVLDSPILQRLRQIRQLGVVHLVYPSALHSRFEHSLGALHQITRVIDSINARSRSIVIDIRHRKLLRLAALCHDIGHGAMSHVSENALRNFAEVEDIRLHFSEEVKVEKPSLSEIAAFYILGGTCFSDLIQCAEQFINERELPVDAVTLIKSAVIGQKISNEVPLLHELISGPFDADKLDYMTRDAHMAGVPIVTDIPRLVQKVRAMELPIAELPQEVQRQVDTTSASYWLTGIAISGGRTLDELLIGRTLLHDKLYRHHKVRACEAMVASIIRTIGGIMPTGPAMLPYLLDDAAILDLTKGTIEQYAGRPFVSDSDLACVRAATDIAGRLRRRQLFVRSYAFAQNMPLDPYRTDTTHVNGLRRLANDARDPEIRGGIVDELVDQLRAILTSLNLDGLLHSIPGGDPKRYIWVDPPQPPTGASEIAQAYLLGESRRWLKFMEDSAEAPSWTNAYLLTRDIGYIFTTSELSVYLFIACERVFRERYGIRTPNSMYGYAKQQEKHIDVTKRKLESRGYYKEALTDLRPKPKRLRAGDIPSRMSSLVARLSGYEGPVRETDMRDGKGARLLNIERLLDWVSQFQSDDLIEAALRTLESVEIIGRTQLVSSLQEFLGQYPDFRGGYITPLGETKDSSSILTYQALDVRDEFQLESGSLADALHSKKPIIFVDDFVCSGRQSMSIFENWLGLGIASDLLEERGQPLDDTLKQRIRSRRIAVLFSSGFREGETALAARCQELGLNVVIKIANKRVPSVYDERIYSSALDRERFLEKCISIGHDLLLRPDEGHDADWARERALGYGNRGLLIVFPYNTPSQTLTCLWAGGSLSGGLPWQPLFPRRKKL